MAKRKKGDCVYVLHRHLMLKCDLSIDPFSKSDLDCLLCCVHDLKTDFFLSHL